MQQLIKGVSCFGLTFMLMIAPVLMSAKKSGKNSQDFATNLTTYGDAGILAEATAIYDSMDLDVKGLNEAAFEQAWKGYKFLLQKGMITKANILSICDFSQSSRNKRLYIIDVTTKELIINTYVAHGKGSGGEFANTFSNIPSSHKSSLGFYVTRDTYQGGHGLSLKIDGVEKGINDKALSRNIVVHGSNYVTEQFISGYKFAGRSFGCPAIPSKETKKIIEEIKGGSCMFIYHPNQQYLNNSRILNS